MDVWVNGEARQVPEGATVAALLEAIGAPGVGIAVEVNQELVRRSEHAARVLTAGDRIEVVGLVGGG